MKTLLLALTISLTSVTASADIIDYSIQVTTEQVVGATVAIILNASSIATTDGKIAATKIQNDIAEYAQSGAVSAYLAEKIKIVTSINPALSEQESIDVLIEATDVILK